MALASAASDIQYSFGTVGGDGEWVRWVRSLGIDPFVAISPGGSFGVRNCLHVLQWLRRTRPDVVYVVGLRAGAIVRLMKPFLHQVRVVHAVRTSFPAGSELAARYRRSEILLKGLTAGYICNSRSGADTLAVLAGLERAGIHVIPNGIDVGSSVDHIPMSRRQKIVSVVANIHPLKCHSAFLDVVANVSLEHPDVLFYFVGRDDMNGALQREVVARALGRFVRLVGFQRDVGPFLVASQVFALPSQIAEGSPTSILEAQALGLPVVAYSIGGVAELVRHGTDGYLIDRGNARAMSDAIVSLLSNVDRAAEMGLAGQRKIQEEFSVERCAQQHAQVWRLVCGTRQS